MNRLFAPMILCLLLFSCSKTSNVAQTPNPSLQGEWELVKFEDSGNFTLLPEEENIILTFNDISFAGITTSNEFGGDYQIESKNILKINKFFTSEAGETEFGKKFYDAFQQAYERENQLYYFTFDVAGTSLKVTYDTGESMVFQKVEN